MFNEEEKKLEKWKEEIKKTEVTENQLELAIKQGFKSAKTKQQIRKRPYVKRGVWSAIIAAILLITLVTSIRVSPVFASAVASLPGMERIVALIQDNKGLQSAINNEHYEEIGVSGESLGIKFSLDGAIADELNMVLFYTMEFKKGHQNDLIDRFELTDSDGKELEWNSISHNYDEDFDSSMKSTNSIEIEWQDPLIVEELLLKVHIVEGNGEKGVIEIPFITKMGDTESKKYRLDKEVLIAEQSMIIENVTISPVRTAIQVRFNSENSMEIFGFEDLRLVDERGKVWSSIINGVTSSSRNPNVVTYFLQSNYFEEPEKLFLQFNKLMAMDKDEAYILIDTEKEEIIKQPKAEHFKKVTMENGYLSSGKDFVRIDFKGMNGFYQQPFTHYIDANGKSFDIMASTNNNLEEPNAQIGIELGGPYKNPIKLPLSGYPSYINGDVKIQIK